MKGRLVIILVIISIHFFGQTNNYIEYYNLTNEGDKQEYLKNDSLAYALYLKAFQKVDYIHSNKLIKATELAIKLKDYKNAYNFSKQAVILGTNYPFYKHKSFKKFRKTDYYKTFKDSLIFFRAEYRKNLNIDYKYQLDSLFYIDQRIIRHNKGIKGKYNIDKSKLPEDLFDLDSLVFANFLSLIEKYGFATEKNIGRETFLNVWIFYHHNIRLPQNEKYIKLAQKAVKEGAYLPRNYAWMFDQSKMFKKEEPFFYYGVFFDIEKMKNKKDLIDKRRTEWGVKPMEAEKRIIRGKTVITKQLW